MLLFTAAPAYAMTTPILSMSGTGTTISNTADSYEACTPSGFNGTAATTTAINLDVPIPISGTMSKLTARFPVSLSGGSSYTVTVLKNGSPTSLAVTITSASILQQDTTDSVSFSAGDTCSIKISPSGTPASQTAPNIPQISMAFDGSTKGESLILTGTSGTSRTVNTYMSLGSSAALSTTGGRGVVFPTNGTIDHMYVHLDSAPGSGNALSITVLQNNASSTITCTITDPATTCTDLTHSITVVPGDLLHIRVLSEAGSSGTISMGMGIRFVPLIDGESVLMTRSSGFTTTSYNYLNAEGTLSNRPPVGANEPNTYAISPVQFTWKKQYIFSTSVPGTGKSFTVYSRINAATSTLAATLADTNTSAVDTSHGPTVKFGDLINWVVASFNSPNTGSIEAFSSVMYIPPVTPAALSPSKFRIYGGFLNIKGGSVKLR